MRRVTQRVPLAERFWAKVMAADLPGECWTWSGSTTRGYGTISRGGRDGPMLAHRASWVIHFGEIPDGLCVLHHCDNPPCCNPEHLFLGTHADNARDKTAKGRHPRPMAKLTHCPAGHAYDEANTYVKKNGWRQCRMCHRDHQQRYLARKRGAPSAA